MINFHGEELHIESCRLRTTPYEFSSTLFYSSVLG